jgi:hypothetical protein
MPSPIVEPATTEMTILAPETILKFQRFEILPESLLDSKPADSLLIWSDPLQLLSFDLQAHLITVPDIDPDVDCLSTSPDGKWLTYCLFSNESPTGRWLIVESADLQQQEKFSMDMNLRYLGDYLWLDNQRLIFPLIRDPNEHPRAYSMMVINPFTGEQLELTSDYPDLRLSVAGPASRMSFNYSDVVYDPSLNLVIFPSWGGEHNYIVLWDRQSKSALAKVEDQSGGFGHYPLWSPDATQFAVPVVNAIKGENIIEEWYSASREGQVEQLTHFGDYFSVSDIGSASNWSPDGQKLAFWVDLIPSPCPGLSLAILDMSTKQVTDTCLPGSSDYDPPPIWSLDSRYIVIRDYSTPPVKTILVELENGRAFDITTLVSDSPPIGWLVSP